MHTHTNNMRNNNQTHKRIYNPQLTSGGPSNLAGLARLRAEPMNGILFRFIDAEHSSTERNSKKANRLFIRTLAMGLPGPSKETNDFCQHIFK